MRKNKLFIFIFIFVFIMFFCVNVGGVFAKQDQYGGGAGVSYSYGIVCVYGGKRKWTTGKSSSNGGGNIDQNYPYTYTLKVNCSNTSCEKLNVSTYGLIKDQDGSKKEIKIGNNDSLNYMVNYNKNKFGFKEGEGVSSCPDKIGFEWDEFLNSAKLDKLAEFGNFLLNSNTNKQGSLESKQKFSVDEARKIDIKSETDSSISVKKRTTTDTTGSGEGSTSTEIENKKQHGKNFDLIPFIKNAAEHSSEEDYGISSDGTVTCAAILGSENVELIHKVLLFMSALGIILVIALGISDFIKAIASSDDDALAQSFKKIRNRIISVIVLLLLPIFVNLVLGLVNDNVHFEIVNEEGKVTEDVSIKIGKASDCD